MNNENVFVRIQTMRDECESCQTHSTKMFRLFDDRNGAIVCFDCASEFGWIAGIDVEHPPTIGASR